MRVGFGYDIHRFKKGRPLVLGGVRIPGPFGLDGHSDADVLIHAVMDALLGAAGLPDIGCQFPNHDARYRNISSAILLGRVCAMLKKEGYRIVNIDCAVIAEKPRISAHVPEMKKRISAILESRPSDIGIKATTNEKLGALGAGKGMACMCVGLIRKR